MRKLIIVFISCMVLLLSGYIGYRGYSVWKQKHLMELANSFAAKGDGRNTLLCVQQVLRANPQNIDASRMMAGILEASNSQNALVWRNRVVELNPTSVNDRLALAESALAFRNLILASNALEAIKASDKKSATYQNVAGKIALAAGGHVEAESHFLEALHLEPQNLSLQFNLALARLQNQDEAVKNEARATLGGLSANPTNALLRCQAMRILVADATREKKLDQALTLSKELISLTNSVFSDRLLYLDVLRETKNDAFTGTLSALQSAASTNIAQVSELASWQMNKMNPAEALKWLLTLPPYTQTNQVVGMLTAECLNLTGDFRSLQSLLEKSNWGELEFVRHAYYTRALRGQSLLAAAKTEWELAFRFANNQKIKLTMLLRLTNQWKWQSEAEEVLWSIVSHFPEEKWANTALSQVLYSGGRTRSLMNYYKQRLKSTPSDLTLKNNLAMTALLLDAQELKPYDLAKEVYQKASEKPGAIADKPEYISTYAFALFLQQKNSEALKIIEQLKPEDLANPRYSGYYGLILNAMGNHAKAKIYLETAFKSMALPEETKLFQLALGV